MRQELKGEIAELRHVMVQSDTRLATVVTELAGDVRGLTHQIEAWRAEHRSDRDEMRGRIQRLESEVFPGPPRPGPSSRR